MMFAPGAIACTASTSRVSSPYQPCGSQGLLAGTLKMPFGTIWRYWLDFNTWVGSLRFEYSIASCRIVGAANASVIPTVTPRPSIPRATSPTNPYAVRSIGGVFLPSIHGRLVPNLPNFGRFVATFWAQLVEHGVALR